ncbi:GNAT family N-acetyltransferase [Haloechinothrix sp. LS1_15]|uniref:GNAT family N-acetyltransferase n=1 Tax=Haloechinothrix sp. LS1_15 TaxID=2652248 RepID=UPI0029449222|nr:GNAT family N-acetyltransferase [Haloechinothrix sp. LS1_15]MDV6012780.1 GNAT family N-acetyltransferase [Haloechinothrix sp. LS1_15]
MLRLAGTRLLDDRDYPAVDAALAADPVHCCMVSARVEATGLDPRRLGGELWAVDSRPLWSGRLQGLCFAGPNLIPLSGTPAILRSFAERALSRARMCSSVVGPAEQVLGIWEELVSEWGPPRDVRSPQPLLALQRPPAVRCDPQVRRVMPHELDRYLPAAVAMFREEVGVDPRAGGNGMNYRTRVAELIQSGRAFARFERGQVVYKAEIGALSSRVGQIQGVWVHPDRRGEGIGTAGTAAVASVLVRELARTASLYVNAYNSPALAVYDKIGFRRVGEYATVLL